MTLYVAAHKSSPLQDVIINLRPSRVIFNPGTENPALQSALETAGIHTEAACTLVLLNTNQF
ncbi:MAG: hypothetical protein O3A51_06440 [Verrucomicrobia bacterium]|nr:hypothetical protein [Verrucomicrobiota bacterium]